MKVSRTIIFWVLLGMTARADVGVGDSYQQVVAALGQPQGEIAAGDYRLLYYGRGKVELRGAKVSKIELVSEAQAEKNRQLRESQMADAQRTAEEARAKRIVDGTAARKTKLADTVFMASPASGRVAYWQNFKKLYPEVQLGDEYTVALRQLEQDFAAQRAEQARQQQISDLEQRVADAEDRAKNAERRSSAALYNDTPVYGYGYSPSWSYYAPYYIVAPVRDHPDKVHDAPVRYGPAFPTHDFVTPLPVNNSFPAVPGRPYYTSPLYGQDVSATVSAGGIELTVRGK